MSQTAINVMTILIYYECRLIVMKAFDVGTTKTARDQHIQQVEGYPFTFFVDLFPFFGSA
jgi:hypothetical protein